MSSYKGHLLGGLGAYFILLYGIRTYIYSYTILIEWLICALLGALFPDIDIKSKGQMLFYQFLLAGYLILLYQKKIVLMAGLSVIAVLPLIVKHRGLFHSLWFLLLSIGTVTILLYTQFPAYKLSIILDSLFFTAGIVSHIILDGIFFKQFKW